MSINYGLYRDLEVRLKRYIDEKLASMLSVSEYSASSADGQSDKVKGYQTEGTDEQAYDFSVRRLFPFGLRARPPSKAGVLAVRIGKGGRSGDGVVVGAESPRFGPSDLAEGEVAVYNKVNGCVVKLDQNGGITITAAAGQVVNINGSDYALPKWDDFMTAFASFLSTLKTVTNATASVVATAATTLDSVRTGANGWKSTKAKNG